MWLEKIGIYGMKNLENAILAGLVTGDPVLLIGTHGTAKTLLCRKLAEALDLNFFAYDASKALFEDLIGFPNPETISKGKVEYVPTSISIWDKEFILIDEISRARAEMQNKWLEIIRGRQVMGLKAEKLKYIFAAMNPPTYSGANPLDEALAGRFAFIIKVPKADEMKADDIKKIINNKTKEDGPNLKNNYEKSLNEEEKIEFLNFLENAKEKYTEISDKLNGKIDDYLTRFLFLGKSKGVTLDSRRLNMIKRNILAYLSVFLIQNKEYEGKELKEFDEKIFEAVNFSMPFEASNIEMSNSYLKFIHEISMDSIKCTVKNDFLNIKNIENTKKITQSTIDKNYQFIKLEITKLIGEIKSKNNIEKKPDFMNILKILVKRICAGEIKFDTNDTERLLEVYKSMYDMSCGRKYKFSGLHYFSVMVKEGIILNNDEDAGDYKVIMNIIRDPDKDDTKMEELKEKLIIYKNYKRSVNKNVN